MVLVLYSLTIFVGAAVLFLVQPMVGKMLLPKLGGSPAVWNTCVVFFQAALLAGYALAHGSVRALGPRRQAVLQMGLLGLGVLALPVAMAGLPPAGRSPIPWLLWSLAAGAGVSFTMLATGGPILQRWFAATGHAAARDPYFLYAASNAGSMIGLLAYPVVLEPMLTLRQQAMVFTAGYGAFGVLSAGCAAVLWMSGGTELKAGEGAGADGIPAAQGPEESLERSPEKSRRGASVHPGERLRWMLYAAVPSSLLLGATFYVTTDISPIPLLWVVPLAIYLLTFILAFAGRAVLPARSVSRLLPVLVAVLALCFLIEARQPIGVIITLHMLVLFGGALLCHSRLAAARPPAARLTEFYFFVALGGVLGGAFNALVVPLAFPWPIEYPAAIVLVCLLRTDPGWHVRLGHVRLGSLPGWAADVLAPLAVLLVMAGAGAFGVRLGLRGFALQMALLGAPCLAAVLFSWRIVGFALAAALLLGMAVLRPTGLGDIVLAERTFFGIYRVAEADDGFGWFRALYHGTTKHGEQRMDEPGRDVPGSYYHPAGPLGVMMRNLIDADDPRLRDVGVVGMGVGSIIAYARPRDRCTFYEIDPAVVRIAENPGLFTYVSRARERGVVYDVAVGDGRRSLERAADGALGVLVLDAFSSDAIPIHLLTREAIEMYRRKLRPDGLLLVHVSNRYLDLAPVLVRTAWAMGMSAAAGSDMEVLIPAADRAQGREESSWVLLVNRDGDFRPDPALILWRPVKKARPADVWTDDYSNIWRVFHWQSQTSAGRP